MSIEFENCDLGVFLWAFNEDTAAVLATTVLLFLLILDSGWLNDSCENTFYNCEDGLAVAVAADACLPLIRFSR